MDDSGLPTVGRVCHHADMSEPGPALNDYLAAEIRAERARRQMTVPELAKRSGIGERSLARYLNGTRDINADTLDAICKALGVSTRDVFGRAVVAREATAPDGNGTALRHHSA